MLQVVLVALAVPVALFVRPVLADLSAPLGQSGRLVLLGRLARQEPEGLVGLPPLQGPLALAVPEILWGRSDRSHPEGRVVLLNLADPEGRSGLPVPDRRAGRADRPSRSRLRRRAGRRSSTPAASSGESGRASAPR